MPDLDFAAIAEPAALLLFGEPNKALSSPRELRWGRKGSVRLERTAGLFADYEAGVHGGALEMIRHRLQCDTSGALIYLRSVGLAGDDQPAKPIALTETSDAERTAAAMALWTAARDPAGTMAEAYLAGRSLRLPADAADVLRFHPSCPFGPGQRHPCLIALMRDIATGEPKAVHRTALSSDAKRIDRKMMGPAGGAAIMLSENASVTYALGIAEGIETALSVLHAGWGPVWALASAGSISRFPVLPVIADLSIFADPDEAGLEAAKTCGQRWADAGRSAYLHVPQGGDFNDITKGGR